MRRDAGFERAVERDLIEWEALSRGERVLVAVSGGPDSMALLAVLTALSRPDRLDLKLHVGHLNHRLRGEASDRDAAFVAARAEELGLPVHVGSVSGLRASDGNLEERARIERLRFLSQTARGVGATSIALGHTLDDQAETVLHRLARGGGISSLAAMEMRRADGVVRPLLRRRRSECARYLEAVGGGAVVDDSNFDRRFTRNHLRHDVLPRLAADLGVDVAARLAALADDLRVEAALADRQIAAWLGEGSGGALPVDLVRSAGPAAGRVLHAWLSRLGLRPTRRQVEGLVRIARGSSPSAGIDLGPGRVERRYGVLALCEPAGVGAPGGGAGAGGNTGPPEALRWPAPGSVALATGWTLSADPVEPPAARASGEDGLVVDADALGPALGVRTVRRGDRIRGRAGRRKLSDVFIDARIPRSERSRLAVVARGADIVWVPGIAVASDVLPGPQTRRWLRLRAERVDCRFGGSVVEMQEFRVRFG